VRLLERLNSPIEVAVALVLFLVLDGFFLYRYQRALQSPAKKLHKKTA
jgi:hypothetical protein